MEETPEITALYEREKGTVPLPLSSGVYVSRKFELDPIPSKSDYLGC